MLFDALVGYLPKTQRKIKQKIINLERNYHEEFYWLCFIRGEEGGIWENDILITDIEELEKR